MNLKAQFRAFYTDIPPQGAKAFTKQLARDAAWQALHPVRAAFYTHAWLTAALTGTAVCAVAGGGAGIFLMLQAAPPPPEEPPIFETQPVTTAVTETTQTTAAPETTVTACDTAFTTPFTTVTEASGTTVCTTLAESTAISTTAAVRETDAPAPTAETNVQVTTVTEAVSSETTVTTAENTYIPPEMNGTQWLLFKDIAALSQLGDALTWYDLAPYQAEDVSTSEGNTVYRFPVMDANSYLYLYAGGNFTQEEKPDFVCLGHETPYTDEDIRSEAFQESMRNAFSFLTNPEDDEAHRQAARTIGEWALSKLRDGTFTLDTQLEADDLDAEMAALFREQDFTWLTFANEHTVHLMLNAGLLDAYGYLVTDGTVQYALLDSVPVTGKGIGYDGGAVTIDSADGNVYHFNAGT